jgi:hypothetical protein
MSDTPRPRSSQVARAALRLIPLVCGALLALGAGVWLARTLTLGEAQLRVGQGPHLYVPGRNYPPPAARSVQLQDASASTPPRTAAPDERPS